MYGYTHDPQTGGLILNDSTPLFSKVPRPVYSYELDIMCFDKYYQYEKQNETPYMWAEANCYCFYTVPELEFVLDDKGNPRSTKRRKPTACRYSNDGYEKP